jgi:hypothetical protein
LVTVLGAINVGTYYFFFGAFGATFGMEDTLATRVLFLAVITGCRQSSIISGLGSPPSSPIFPAI